MNKCIFLQCHILTLCTMLSSLSHNNNNNKNHSLSSDYKTFYQLHQCPRNFLYVIRPHLNKQFKNLVTQMKTHFQLPPIDASAFETSYAALCMVYEFLYTLPSTLKFHSLENKNRTITIH